MRSKSIFTTLIFLLSLMLTHLCFAQQEAMPSLFKGSVLQAFAEQLTEVVRQVDPSVVVVKDNRSQSATGVIYNAEGYILTIAQIVNGAEKLEVILPSGSKYEAIPIGADTATGIGVIKITASNLLPAQFGDSDQLKKGEFILVIGNSYGLSNSLATGIISGLDRNINGREFIQITAPINPGMSGAPVINSAGEVVGIVKSTFRRATASRRPAWKEANHEVRLRIEVTPWLGTDSQTTEKNVIHVVGAVRKPGAYALKKKVTILDALFMAGGVTENADIKNARIVKKYSNPQVFRLVDLEEALIKGTMTEDILLESGDTILVPKMEPKTVPLSPESINFAIPINDVKFAAEQLIKTGIVTRGWLGIKVQPIPDALRAQLNLEEPGILVTDIMKDSPAQKAGIERWDIILEFQGKPIDSAKTLQQRLYRIPPDEEVELLILRKGQQKKIKAQIEALKNESERPTGLMPTRFRIGNFPNPMTDDTWITYELPEEARLTFSIHNVGGELIRRIDLGKKKPGYYTTQANAAYWDGTDESGNPVPNGVYLCAAKAGKASATIKILVLR